MVSFHIDLVFGYVINPNGGEALTGNFTIEWTAFDILGHNLTYSVFYSADGGISWVLLKAGLTSLYYTWDTTTVGDGFQYLIKANASCSEGKWHAFTSDATFTINNHHHLQSFTIFSPVEGETYFGQVIIQWSAGEDIFNHSITYTVSYSPDNGISWLTLASNLSTTLYIWDSTTVTDGSQYLIQVNASCSEDSWRVTISDAVFTIDNVPTATSFPSTQISNSSNQSDTPLDLLPILQILGSVAILSFAVTSIIIIRRQRIGKSKVLQEI